MSAAVTPLAAASVRDALLPIESMALTVAAGRCRLDYEIEPNMATMLALALLRITGEYDYTTVAGGQP